ncbi:hypothetical protein M5689_001701 [Euphorbia peplus]|nr:hypothetical protein M5689_001701 [Euphorbia peplus]
MIFDKTATEIDYPVTRVGHRDNERANNFDQEQAVPNVVHDDEAEDDDVSAEILDHFSPSMKTNTKSPTSLPSRPEKKINPETSVKTLNPQCPTDVVEGN